MDKIEYIALATLLGASLIQSLVISHYKKMNKKLGQELDWVWSPEGQRQITQETLKNKMWRD
ncbi:hypothetical protein [Streptococcus iniae]|uniref:hypothetical protein n=1 Tax=Streptococcus iniae TaxID=1346 RepID=UPI0003348084|nr:hypothetical protein [Streptococcus iniae]AGM99820.1 hypothetical protein K710_2078 [Streptococcus iniae SF1]QBX16829.1 hypothetical protein Javan275_0038 [Streptococcus phage Javan275]QBX25759.1 hypothetical protein Javan272_0010 [Streptococcus phage Javan272]ELY5748913.1 hypothetical protein [Streptococcus iniae]ELY5750847.1 hypothetical protein [Streptococcus iniae]